MNPVLMASLIQNLFVPLIASIVRAHVSATGTSPTDAQVIAALGTDTTNFANIGIAFLNQMQSQQAISGQPVIAKVP